MALRTARSILSWRPSRGRRAALDPEGTMPSCGFQRVDSKRCGNAKNFPPPRCVEADRATAVLEMQELEDRSEGGEHRRPSQESSKALQSARCCRTEPDPGLSATGHPLTFGVAIPVAFLLLPSGPGTIKGSRRKADREHAMGKLTLRDAEWPGTEPIRPGRHAGSGQTGGNARRSVEAASLGKVRHFALTLLHGTARPCAAAERHFGPSEGWIDRHPVSIRAFLPGIEAGMSGPRTR